MPRFFNLSKQDATNNPQIDVKNYDYGENKYDIFKYNKESLAHDDYNGTGLYRSVIYKGNSLVSVGPSKSMQIDSFMEKYDLNQNITCEELVEGTMVNLFYDPTLDEQNYAIDGVMDGSSEIATRGTVGGNVSFFQGDTPTFRRMFLEICAYINFDLGDLKMVDDDFFYCYSFVMQHPLNRIVKPIDTPALFLVDLHKIRRHETNSETLVTKMNYRRDTHREALGIDKCNFSYPDQFKYALYNDAINECNSMSMDYTCPGIVFNNICTGERSKYRNKSYEAVKALRGNHPKFQYQYLVLRQKGMVTDFLKYYPEKSTECEGYRGLVHHYTNELHSKYVACYVHKEKPLIEFGQQYRTHMYNIHTLYLLKYKDQQKYIGLPVVIQYVNEMPVSHLMHSLNFNFKSNKK